MNSQKNNAYKPKSLAKWRLILGKYADQSDDLNLNKIKGNKLTDDINNKNQDYDLLNEELYLIDESLSYVYDHEYDPSQFIDELSNSSYSIMEDLWDLSKSKAGSSDGSAILTIPKWINNIKNFFPKETQEILTKDAIERYNLTGLLTEPEILENIEPSLEITKLLLSFRDHLNQKTLEVAKRIIRQTVKQLESKFKREIETTLLGRKNRHKPSKFKVSKNFDIKKTVRMNLKNISDKKLIVKDLFFNSRIKKSQEWHIIILVDQSGSMLDNIIHSSIIASIFYSISTIKTSFCLFDTKVYDMTYEISDPVEVLLSVQLGGGTNINAALRYGSKQSMNPEKTLIILISDFYEGVNENNLLTTVKQLIESKFTLLGLTAIDSEGSPDFNKSIAEKCVLLGMNVISATPSKLAEIVSDIIE